MHGRTQVEFVGGDLLVARSILAIQYQILYIYMHINTYGHNIIMGFWGMASQLSLPMHDPSATSRAGCYVGRVNAEDSKT